MINNKKRTFSSNNDNSVPKDKFSEKIETEKKELKDFQSAVALSLLKYTADLEDEYVERRLASALLFLTHLSSEITKGFANGDEKLASNLLADAIIECRRAYPDGKTKLSTFFPVKSKFPRMLSISSLQSKIPSVKPIPGTSMMWYHSQSSKDIFSEGGFPQVIFFSLI